MHVLRSEPDEPAVHDAGARRNRTPPRLAPFPSPMQAATTANAAERNGVPTARSPRRSAPSREEGDALPARSAFGGGRESPIGCRTRPPKREPHVEVPQTPEDACS